MSTIKESTVTSFDGLVLYTRTWCPPPNVPTKARILFVHGFGEFAQCYDDWFPRVAEDGYEVTSYDQRGFGNTAKKVKAEGKSNEALVMNDLESMVNYVSDGWKGKLILWGFSMGGATCLNYMVIGKKKELFDLYISGGPEIEVSKELKQGFNGLKMKLLPYAVKILPNYTETIPLAAETANNNPKNWELYPKQELRTLVTSVEYMNDALIRGKRLLDPAFIANIVDKPLLLSQGTGDRICDPDASKEFIEKVKLTDKTLDLHPDMPHELMHNMPENQDELWKVTKQWIDARVSEDA